VITLPDGQPKAAVAKNDKCIASGHFGLRSSLTNARWRNVEFKPASINDIRSIEPQSSDFENLSIMQPFVEAHAQQYESSLRTEARKHTLQAGVQPIVKFLLSPGRHPNVTIQGVMISTPHLPIFKMIQVFDRSTRRP
jgi:hypothetical protein